MEKTAFGDKSVPYQSAKYRAIGMATESNVTTVQKNMIFHFRLATEYSSEGGASRYWCRRSVSLVDVASSVLVFVVSVAGSFPLGMMMGST